MFFPELAPFVKRSTGGGYHFRVHLASAFPEMALRPALHRIDGSGDGLRFIHALVSHEGAGDVLDVK
jgi:hypothetical protein